MPASRVRAIVIILTGGLLVVGCGWQRHTLTPSAKAVKVTKAEPPATCALKGTFFTYRDCLGGLGTCD